MESVESLPSATYVECLVYASLNTDNSEVY